MFGSPDLGPGRVTPRSDYPVTVDIILPLGNSRFFAIPLVGFLARTLMLIPHVFVLGLLGFVVVLSQLILWVAVLFAGRHPKWGYTLIGGYLRWNVRVMAYAFGLTDRYPPFRLAN